MSEHTKGEEVIRRYERLRNERATFDERWERMAPLVAPSRVGITTMRSQGEKQTGGVYDSTTMMAAEMMAMFIAGHIINPAQQWLQLRMKDQQANEIDDVVEWLEESRDRMLNNYASSLFYAEGPESLIDYGGFGTGFLLCEEAPATERAKVGGFRGFHFHAEKTGRFVIAEGPDGLVDTAMREFILTARVIKERFGSENLPENISKALEKGELDKSFSVIHAILPREDQQYSAGAIGMPVASCWVEKEAKKVLFEGGYRTFPVAVPRYHKTPGEVYGRGRGDLAFPDAWTLNTAKRMALEDWALKIRPPVLMRHDSVIGTLRLVPGGPTSVNTHGAALRDVIAPFETGSRPEVSQVKEEELRRSIREIFFVDSIRQLLESHKSEQTAYEFAKKLELLFRLLGPVYGRLEWEYLHRIVEITFDTMFYSGAFSPPPQAIYDTDGEILIEFQNPIAKAQRAGDAEAVTLAIQDLAPIYQIDQSVFDWLDVDKTARGVFATRGVPARWTRSDREVIAIREARAAAAQQQQQAMMMAQMAESAGKAAPLVKALQPK